MMDYKKHNYSDLRDLSTTLLIEIGLLITNIFLMIFLSSYFSLGYVQMLFNSPVLGLAILSAAVYGGRYVSLKGIRDNNFILTSIELFVIFLVYELLGGSILFLIKQSELFIIFSSFGIVIGITLLSSVIDDFW